MSLPRRALPPIPDETLRDLIGVAVPFGRHAPHQRHERRLQAMLDDPALAAARVAGRALTLEQAVAYALEETARYP